MTLFDALILCRFYRDLITWQDLREIVKAACGLSLSKKELRTVLPESSISPKPSTRERD